MSDWMNMHALADGALDPEAKAAAEAQASQNPALRNELETVQNLKTLLNKHSASAASQSEISQSWKQCVRRLDEIDKAKKVNAFVGRYAWVMSGLLFVVIASAAIMNRLGGSDPLQAGDIPRMMSGLTPISAPSKPNVEDMQRWMREATDNAPFKLPNESVRVAAYAQSVVNGRKVVQFNLVDGNGAMTLLIVAGTDAIEGCEPMARTDYEALRIDDTNAIAWHANNSALLLLGDRTFDQLVQFAENIRIR